MTVQKSSAANSAALLERVRQLLDRQATGEALEALNTSGLNTRAVQNAKGVCLMRIGRVEGAAKILCELVLPKGAFTIPDDVPAELRANYAATWFLQGDYVAGAAILGQAPDRRHPAVKRLKAALQAWKKTLPWWRRVLLPLGVNPKTSLPAGPEIGELWLPEAAQTVGPDRGAA